MTNQDYWQTIIGDQSPEDFLRGYGTADPDIGLERFIEDRGQLYGVFNQQDWVTTFGAENQFQILTVQVYLRSYLEETRDDWQPALEAQPPKVVRRYKPVYDFPLPDEDASENNLADTTTDNGNVRDEQSSHDEHTAVEASASSCDESDEDVASEDTAVVEADTSSEMKSSDTGVVVDEEDTSTGKPTP